MLQGAISKIEKTEVKQMHTILFLLAIIGIIRIHLIWVIILIRFSSSALVSGLMTWSSLRMRRIRLIGAITIWTE